jgi:integrase
VARPRNSVPPYKLHKPSGQARIRLNGNDIYLGKYDSPESRQEYARIVAELSNPQSTSKSALPGPGRTVNEILVTFVEHAEEHYRRPDGSHTNELKEYRLAIRPLRELYGHTQAANFGPVALRAVRDKMIGKGWCRTRVNKQIGRLKRIFKWAVGQELIPVSVFQSLGCVEGLQKGRTKAREMDPVLPVPNEVIDATLPYLWPTVRTMVELQRLTGLRPGEVRCLRPSQVDRTEDVWIYRPVEHKNAHRGKDRVVPFGPRARALLTPWFEGADPEKYLFSPIKAKEERFAEWRKSRKSKVPPSQVNRRKALATMKKQPRERFTDDGYAAVVRRACERAGVEPWHPNQLRHTFGTAVRKDFGLEAAQVTLGHSKADVTQIYAERNLSLAIKVAAEIG